MYLSEFQEDVTYCLFSGRTAEVITALTPGATAEIPTVGAGGSPYGKRISKARQHAAHKHRLAPSVGSLGAFKTNCTHFKAKPLIIVMKPFYLPGLERELLGTAVGGRMNRLPDGIRLGFTVVKVHTYMCFTGNHMVARSSVSNGRDRKRHVSLGSENSENPDGFAKNRLLRSCWVSAPD